MRLLTVGLDSSFQFDHPTDKAVDEEDALSLLVLGDYDCCLANPIEVGEYFPTYMRKRGIKTPLITFDPIHNVQLRINMLARGADRCIMIPIDKRELEAYLQALVRRCNGIALSRELRIGDITLDTENKTVSVTGESVHLTIREYGILEYLMQHPERVVSRESIMLQLYNGVDVPDVKIVDVLISKIRNQRFTMLSYNPIETYWCRGYKIFDPEKERKVA